jgi:hypothetical protein
MAPHWGHLTFVSLDVPAHPKKQIVKIANAKRILNHFRITRISFPIFLHTAEYKSSVVDLS